MRPSARPNPSLHRFTIAGQVSLEEAEQSLHLAMIVAEGLFSPAAVRLDFRYRLDESARVFVLDVATDVGTHVSRVFATLLAKEFGDDGFEVTRLAFPLAHQRDGSVA